MWASNHIKQVLLYRDVSVPVGYCKVHDVQTEVVDCVKSWEPAWEHYEENSSPVSCCPLAVSLECRNCQDCNKS